MRLIIADKKMIKADHTGSQKLLIIPN